MAIIIDNIIDKDLLSYYDENLKKWVAKSSSIKFVTNDELSKPGESGILYITKDSIKYWDAEQGNYTDISTGRAGTWGRF